MPELEFYGMFDYSAGDSDTYEYTAAEFAALIEALSGTGIAASVRDEFACTSNGLQITVGGGTCFIKGRYGYNKSAVNLMLDAEAEAYQRIDRIILELDIASRTITLGVLKGTAASTAAAPELTQTDALWQISLCQALIAGGSTVTLTDERTMTYAPTSVITQLQELEAAMAAKADKTDITAKANKAVTIQSVLSASGWTENTQTITVEEITGAADDGDIGLAPTVTAEQMAAAASAMLLATAQAAGSITITAFGEVPTVDIPILVRVVRAG